MCSVSGNLCFYEENILADIDTVNNSLLSRVFADYIFIKESKCPFIRGSGQTDNKRVKIGQYLTPDIIDGPMTLIDNDAVKEFRRIFRIVNDFLRRFRFRCHIFLKRNFFRALIKFFPLQDRVHSLNGADTDLNIIWNIGTF